MTARELELAKRHLAALEDMRDNAWRGVHGDHAYPSVPIAKHEALAHACRVVRSEIVAAEAAPKATSAAA